MNNDDISLMSDATGGGGGGELGSSDLASAYSLEALRVKRGNMLAQQVFADTQGQDTHTDQEAHVVEVSTVLHPDLLYVECCTCCYEMRFNVLCCVVSQV
jgi:hypothetical protein